MLIKVLKSKIHLVRVTEANADYEGSITIDQNLLDAANIWSYQEVDVHGKDIPSRISTYVLPGRRDSGIISLNGGAAQFFTLGDEIHILSWGWMSPDDYKLIGYKPILVHVNQNNKLKPDSYQSLMSWSKNIGRVV